MALQKPTAYDRECIRRALHTLSANLTAGQWAEIGDAAQRSAHAGMQLGTSSQARAIREKLDIVERVVSEIPGHYVADMAGYIVENRTPNTTDEGSQ